MLVGVLLPEREHVFCLLDCGFLPLELGLELLDGLSCVDVHIVPFSVSVLLRVDYISSFFHVVKSSRCSIKYPCCVSLDSVYIPACAGSKW